MQTNILDYLNHIAALKPDKTAFADDRDALTFGQLHAQSRAVGTWLHRKGVYREPVVVYMNRHPKEVAAFYGVVTGGCFYVPVDEEMPKGRIQLILNTVHSGVIICDAATKKTAEALDFQGEIVLYDEISQTEPDQEALQSIHRRAIDTDLVYIMFTSGSTGVPKGVAVCHRSLIDYIEQLSEVMGFSEDTVFGNQTPLHFDASLKEVYPTLKFGATTYLIPKNLFMFPVKLVEFLNQKKVNTICWVVSALTMVSAFGAFKTAVPEYLRTIAFGGEVFPVKQYQKWKAALPEARFVNLYGPTEGTGVCCYYQVDREFGPDEVIPIGHSFPNKEILLINDKNQRAAQGEVGEICIRGASLALGYYNNPEKTSEAFVQNPLNSAYPERIYRTGDLGRYNERGELQFVSRKDYQIKHMGHRIELGEIEANVNALEEIKTAGCIYDKARDKILLYYEGEMEEKDVAAALKDRLPRYMIPNHISRLERMPLTANGKVDRVTLKNNYQEGKEK